MASSERTLIFVDSAIFSREIPRLRRMVARLRTLNSSFMSPRFPSDFPRGLVLADSESNTISSLRHLLNSFHMDICRREFGACILAGLGSGLLPRSFALPPRPKLLVLVVLEQIRPDYLDAIWVQVGRGGLRRLVENGAYFPDCRHLASSFPLSSLATLATATWPAQHGIVADRWYDRRERGPIRASAESLLATTFASQVAESLNSRVFVVSHEETKGALFAGTPLARLFWMGDDGRVATRGDSP